MACKDSFEVRKGELKSFCKGNIPLHATTIKGTSLFAVSS
jgi:hypothetical protein